MPDIAKNNTNWVLKDFRDWRPLQTFIATKECKPECPKNLLGRLDEKQVNFWLPGLVAKVHNRKEEP